MKLFFLVVFLCVNALYAFQNNFKRSSLISTSLNMALTSENKKLTKIAEIPPIIPAPCYNLALGTSVICGFNAVTGNIFNAVGFGLLALLFAVQAGRVKFVFEDDAMELKIGNDNKNLNDSGENIVVGGANRWDYNTFTSWLFIPLKEFPILFYFKENQTKPEGQVHFFPIIVKANELNDILMEKVGKK